MVLPVFGVSAFLFLWQGSFPFAAPVGAVCDLNCSTYEECETKKGECQTEIDARLSAHNKNKADLAALEKSVKDTQALIASVEKQIANLEGQMADREEDLEFRKEVLAVRIRQAYKRSRRYSPFLLFLSSANAADLFRELSYRQMVTDEDKRIITETVGDLQKLSEDRAKQAGDQEWLQKTKARLADQAALLGKEVGNVEGYFSEVSSKIAQLSAKQQAILSEKQGTFQISVGEVPPADDPASRPDYNPGFSPAFAAFSFGAPHFKGMSQYGAFGRAKSGQSYEEILRAYYGGGIELRSVDVNTQIVVDGYGAYSLEDYARRIYEMPGSWGDEGGMEALKAQAVAARSYALARGGSICATESCQVFKPDPKGGNWERAVNETSGRVVFANGAPLSTWYASTSGGYQESYSSNGYTTPGFWDTPSGRSGWTSEAYEKVAGSPWFYKGWYRNRSGDSCGRSHPWLTGEEMADILNAWVVLYHGGGDSTRVVPESACWGGNPYSKAELRELGGYTSVSGANVQYSDGGVTAKVTFQTNKGSTEISGSEFYKAFNLRAPGRIALKSGLFNLEKK